MTEAPTEVKVSEAETRRLDALSKFEARDRKVNPSSKEPPATRYGLFKLAQVIEADFKACLKDLEEKHAAAADEKTKEEIALAISFAKEQIREWSQRKTTLFMEQAMEHRVGLPGGVHAPLQVKPVEAVTA